MHLTIKQERFVAEYLIDLNGKQAAIRAGYSPKVAEVTASKLLRAGKVAVAVREAQKAHLAPRRKSADDVLEELERVGFSVLPDFYYDNGSAKPLSELTADQRAALSTVETIIKNAKAGDGEVDEVLKLRTHDKLKALEILAKHHRLLTEIVEVTGAITLEQRLTRGRDRLAKNGK